MSNNDIIVVAGGWSIGQYDRVALETQLKKMTSIGVNDSAFFLPCSIALSMDRLWTEARFKQISWNYRWEDIWIRKGVTKNTTLPDGVRQFQHTGKTTEMTSCPGYLNGSNSGACAVNLAWQLAKPGDRVFLLGFDMQDGPNAEKHWYPNYPWRPNGATKAGNFRDWAEEFALIARQFVDAGILLVNVNHRSAIKNLTTISFTDFCKL